MKKIILLIAVLFFAVGFSQTITFNGCHTLFNNQDFTFSLAGTDTSGHNIYETTPIDGQPCGGIGTCEFRISWNETESRWEFLADSGNGNFSETYVIYYNTSNTSPNPPGLNIGTWVENTSTTENECNGNLSADNCTFTGNGLTNNSCNAPDVPNITANDICTGSTATLNITGDLKDATYWHIYTDSCGGTEIGTTTTSSFTVTPTSTTTYYIRGEGECVTPADCGIVTVRVNAMDNASFSYAQSSYGTTDAAPTPTITGNTGGTFSSASGLTIDSATGMIDVSTSTPGMYTIIYTTNGSCPNNATFTLEILDGNDNGNACAAPSSINIVRVSPTEVNISTDVAVWDMYVDMFNRTPAPSANPKSHWNNLTNVYNNNRVNPNRTYYLWFRQQCDYDVSEWTSVHIVEPYNQPNSAKVNVSPNPTHGKITFNSVKAIQAKVFDMRGKLVLKSEVYNNSLNLNQLKKGNYIVHVTDVNGKVEQMKIIKK